MITGYNTDIEFNGIVYHVQTEDKGPSVPLILSLVYDRGTILASKRALYDDLVAEDLDESVLAERLQRQHKLMCAAVVAGRIDDLKRMSAAARDHKRLAEGKLAAGASSDTAAVDSATDAPQITDPASVQAHDAAALPDGAETHDAVPIPMPVATSFENFALNEDTELTILDDVRVLEEYDFLSPEEIDIVSDLAGTSRPEHDHLSVDFVGSPEFKSGHTSPIFILVCRGSRREVIRGADIMVKVLGASFRPVIYHSVTDRNGLANIDVEVPQFNSGRAVVLARVISNGDEVEARCPVFQG